MWREMIGKYTSDCKFGAPASLSQIATAERSLEVKLPDELQSLLLEGNGISGEYGIGLIWPVERVRDDNLAFRRNEDFRQLYMPFDNLLFFADAGNGDQFAFPIQVGRVRRPDVFCWNHEDDSRKWVAPTLEKYLEWWLTGQMKV